MGSYSTNYLKGAISALILAAVIAICFYVLIPPWAGIIDQIAQVAVTLSSSYPGLSGAPTVFRNLSASVNVAFSMMLLFPIIYVLILPFMRSVNEEPNIGGAW